MTFKLAIWKTVEENSGIPGVSDKCPWARSSLWCRPQQSMWRLVFAFEDNTDKRNSLNSGDIACSVVRWSSQDRYCYQLSEWPAQTLTLSGSCCCPLSVLPVDSSVTASADHATAASSSVLTLLRQLRQRFRFPQWVDCRHLWLWTVTKVHLGLLVLGFAFSFL